MIEVSIIIGTIVKQDFAWMCVHAQPYLIEHLYYSCRKNFHVLFISSSYFIEEEEREFNNL